MFKIILPNGERLRIEAWVYREWIEKRLSRFDVILSCQLDRAVRIVRYR
jgi:hypothetical protein